MKNIVEEGGYVLFHPINGLERFDNLWLAQSAATKRAKEWNMSVTVYKEAIIIELTGEVNVKVLA